MRIGILLTSNDTSDFAARHPHDGEKFTTLMKPQRPQWEYQTVSVKDDIFPNNINDFDGYIITGSPASVHDGHDWISHLLEFMRELHREKKPTVAACFGHQAFALALGGEVKKNPKGWGLGLAPTRFTTRKPWMEPWQETVTLYSAHKEIVTRLPAEAELLGGDEFCPTGAYCIGDHLFTTEYHPEMTTDFLVEMTDEMKGVADEELLARAREDYRKPSEGDLFAQWMARFLEMPRSQ